MVIVVEVGVIVIQVRGECVDSRFSVSWLFHKWKKKK